MFAASSLVVAVLATYASVAVLSLSATAPSFFGEIPGVASVVKGIGWSKPSLSHALTLANPASSLNPGALADVSFITLSSAGSAPSTSAVNITNSSSAGLALKLTVHDALGVSASFQGTNGSTTVNVAPHGHATVALSSDPMHAGPINGTLEISAPGLQSLMVRIQGDQAPLPAGAVTATPAARGAINLSWAPSPSTGVAGYLVERAPAGSSAFQQVGALTSGTTAVDQTSTDATYSYEVVAVATGTGSLPSTPGPVASATSDSIAPAQPDSVNPPAFINVATGNSVQIPVNLANDSVSSDTITVRLTDSTGASVSGQANGGGASVSVPVSNLDQLADGKITVAATATDSVGNTSGAAMGFMQKNTATPSVPTFDALPKITDANVTNVPITVLTAPASAGDQVTVQISDGSNTATAKGTEAANDTSITLTPDASALADGNNLTVTATVTNTAGNTSPQASATIVKDTAGPTAPTSIGVAAGPDNPAGVVNAASQNAVIVQATFDQAPPADDQMVFWVAGQSYPVQGDGQSATITLPPIDLSNLPDGTYNVGVKQTDGDGNITRTWSKFTKDASGPTAPTSVGVPAGPNNPAGYVNAATQTAVTIVASFAGPTDPADQIALSVGGLALAPQSGGSDQAVFTGDLSGLPDGTLQILGTITDPNGVSTSFSGTLIKDTQAPPAPAAAYVVGPPPNTITNTDASCVKVAVAFNQAPDPADMVTVTLSDENTSVQGSAPAGDGQVEIGCIDASSLSAGHIAVNVTVTDAAGNSTSVAGTTATKLDCPQNQS